MTEKSAAELEREAELYRSRMADTADSLRAKMTPGQMLDEVADYFKGSDGSLAFTNLKNQVRDNPLPVALVGIGLAWLFAGSAMGRGPNRSYSGGHSGPRYRSAWDDGYAGDYEGAWSGDSDGEGFADRASGMMSDVGDAASSAASGIGDAASSAASGVASAASGLAGAVSATVGAATSAVRGAAHVGARTARMTGRGVGAAAGGVGSAAHGIGGAASGLGRAASHAGERLYSGSRQAGGYVRSGYSELLQIEPLVLAAMGVAVGAALGAAFPATRMEKETVGPYRDKAGEKVKEMADTVMSEASEVATEALDTFRQSAEESGLKEQGTHLAEAVGDVIKQTAGSVETSVRDSLGKLHPEDNKQDTDRSS